VARRELARARADEVPGALLEDERVAFLIVGPARRADREEPEARALRARARRCVAVHLVEGDAVRVARREPASARDVDRVVTGRGRGVEVVAHLDSKGEALTADERAKSGQERARVARVVGHDGFRFVVIVVRRERLREGARRRVAVGEACSRRVA